MMQILLVGLALLCRTGNSHQGFSKEISGLNFLNSTDDTVPIIKYRNYRDAERYIFEMEDGMGTVRCEAGCWEEQVWVVRGFSCSQDPDHVWKTTLYVSDNNGFRTRKFETFKKPELLIDGASNVSCPAIKLHVYAENVEKPSKEYLPPDDFTGYPSTPPKHPWDFPKEPCPGVKPCIPPYLLPLDKCNPGKPCHPHYIPPPKGCMPKYPCHPDYKPPVVHCAPGDPCYEPEVCPPHKKDCPNVPPKNCPPGKMCPTPQFPAPATVNKKCLDVCGDCFLVTANTVGPVDTEREPLIKNIVVKEGTLAC